MKGLWYAILFCSFVTNAQVAIDVKQEALDLKKILVNKHVEGRAVDDQFSEDVFNKVIGNLDPDKIIFTNEEITNLAEFKFKIDDEISGKEWRFFPKLKSVYQIALTRRQQALTQIMAKPIDWSSKSVSFEKEPGQWPKDEANLNARHSQWLKYQVLRKMTWLVQRDSVATEGMLSKYEKPAVELVKKIESRRINHILNYDGGFDNYVTRYFFHAITTVYDPHTLYLSPEDLKRFQDQLATEGFYFGFSLDDNDDGDVVISSLTPGGPAWNSGALDISDVLVGLKAKDSEALDLNGFSLEEVNNIIDEIASDEVEFSVLKSDGVVKNVTLKKEKIVVEENFVRSFVLKGNKRVGYIHLPDFYTSWNGRSDASRCANDVAKEVIKLKKEGIEGLILDVRFNGGGSLLEAIAMTGIFVDQGPVGILKSKDEAVVLKDLNRGTIYDGPMIVMVNGQSASASEFLAGALQDYNRALIVGSRTFGKGTGQSLLPLKENVTEQTAFLKKQAFIKITTERLYRITGASVQQRGVVPDIQLPDVFSSRPISEEKYSFSLKNDSITKKTFYKPLSPMPINTLVKMSKARVSQSHQFKELVSAYDWYIRQRGNKEISLVPKDYITFLKERKEMVLLLEKAEAATKSGFTTIVNNGSINNTDAYHQQLNKEWNDRLIKDLHLAETYQILVDFIKLNAKP